MSQNPNETAATENVTDLASSSKGDAKVELDLDDAPFLNDEEPEPEPKKPPKKADQAPTQPPEPVDEKKGLSKKKKIAIAGGAVGFLLVVGIVLKLFVFAGDPPPPKPLPAPEPEKVLATPQLSPPAPVPQFTLQWEPFWVELKDTEGAIRFLTVKFSIPTDNPVLFAEMNAKMLILRDALFYYLRNQPIISLSDEAKVKAFKGDLLTVINEHLGGGKASEILVQDYLVQ